MKMTIFQTRWSCNGCNSHLTCSCHRDETKCTNCDIEGQGLLCRCTSSSKDKVIRCLSTVLSGCNYARQVHCTANCIRPQNLLNCVASAFPEDSSSQILRSFHSLPSSCAMLLITLIDSSIDCCLEDRCSPTCVPSQLMHRFDRAMSISPLLKTSQYRWRHNSAWSTSLMVLIEDATMGSVSLN